MPKYLAFLAALLLLTLPASGQQTQNLLTQADVAFDQGHYTQATLLYDSLLTTARTVTPRMLQRQAYMAENRSAIPQTLYYLSLLYSATQDDLVRLRIEALARQYQLEGYDYDEWDLFRQALRNYAPYILGVFAAVVGLLVFVLFRRRLQGRPLRLLPLTIFIILGAAALLLNLNLRYGKAIVLEQDLIIMPEASAAAKPGSLVKAGTRLTVIGQDDAWLHVMYNGQPGYVNRFLVGYF